MQAAIHTQGAADDAVQVRLSAEQWQGLAFLGDIGCGLQQGLHGPLGEALTAAAVQAGTGIQHYELPGLLAELLDTVQALRDSGLLAVLRDNAALVVETLRLTAQLLDDGVDVSLAAKLQAGRAELAAAFGGWRKLRLLMEFIDTQLGDVLLDKALEWAELLRDLKLKETLPDLLLTLRHLYDNGMLARLRSMSDLLTAALQDVDGQAWVEAVDQRVLAKVRRAARAVDEALTAAYHDQGKRGGYAGLLHLLRDADVQAGLRVAALLMAYLERMAGAVPAPSATTDASTAPAASGRAG